MNERDVISPITVSPGGTRYAADPLCRRPAMPPTRYAADPHYAIFIGNNHVFRKSINRTDRRFK